MLQQILAKLVNQPVANKLGCRALYNLRCRASIYSSG